MKKLVTSLFRILVVFLATGISLTSCTRGGRADVQFVSIPGEVARYNEAGFDNRVPEGRSDSGAYIYIVGLLKEDIIRRDPIPVIPGEDFQIQGLPVGRYSSLALYYSPVLLDDSVASLLPLPGQSLDEYWDTVGSPQVADQLLDNSGAVALFRDLSVKRFRTVSVEAALVPLSSELFEGPNGAPPRCPDTNGAVKKQFIRLEPNGAGRIYVMLSNFDGAGIVYAGTVSLYSASGAKLETKTFNRDIPADGPESVLFTLPFDDVSYLYLEYAAKGDRALPLFYF